MTTNITFSYCLWGTNPKYLVGATKQAPAIHKFFPHATVLFFLGDDVPPETIQVLSKQGCRLVFSPPDVADKFCWRFLAWQYATWRADYICYRDVDSRITAREALSVYYWIASDKKFHVMKDHPHHHRPILAGMWGHRTDVEFQTHFYGALQAWPNKETKLGECEKFLADFVHPWIKGDVCEVIPGEPVDGAFIGERIDENEQPNQADREARNV
jgi:hypothetical protein